MAARQEGLSAPAAMAEAGGPLAEAGGALGALVAARQGGLSAPAGMAEAGGAPAALVQSGQRALEDAGRSELPASQVQSLEREVLTARQAVLSAHSAWEEARRHFESICDAAASGAKLTQSKLSAFFQSTGSCLSPLENPLAGSRGSRGAVAPARRTPQEAETHKRKQKQR